MIDVVESSGCQRHWAEGTQTVECDCQVPHHLDAEDEFKEVLRPSFTARSVLGNELEIEGGCSV